MNDIRQITRKGFVAVLFATTATPALLAAEEDISSQIERVKLYRSDGAVVHRAGTLSLPAGNHVITIKNLPADIDEDYALRAGLTNGAGTISRIELDTSFSAETSAESQQDILKQIDALKGTIEDRRASIEAIELELGFLGKLQSESGSDNADTLTLISTNARRLLKEKLTLNRGISETTNKVNALKRQLDRMGDLRTETTTATITLSKTSDSPATINFSYLTNDVSVDFQMAAEVNTSTSNASVSLSALISQDSGEDWSNVPITITSSRIRSGLGVETPEPIYQNLAERRALNELSVRRAQMESLADVQEIVVTGNKIHQGTFETDFEIEHLVTIPSDSSEQRVLLIEERVDLNLKVKITPQEDTTAYLVGEASFKTLPSLSSPSVTLVRDGQYLGEGYWPDLISGQPIELPLGYVEQFKTEVTKLPSDDGESGIFGRSVVDETKYRFDITNNLASAYAVEVYDVLPQPMNEDLEIKPLSDSTRYTATDIGGKPGVNMWRRTVDAGETWSIKHEYRTKYPQGKIVIDERR